MSQEPVAKSQPSRYQGILVKLTVWLIAAGCFYLVYRGIDKKAAEEQQSAWVYLANFFAEVNWGWYILLMLCYSMFFVLVDSHALWRVMRWFNVPELRWQKLLPIRASAYILSLMNEQVGKGALTLYLFKSHQVPLLKGISSMIYSGMMEISQLLIFASIGLALHYQTVATVPADWPLAEVMLTVMVVATIYFVLHVLYFDGRILANWRRLRDLQICHSFAKSSLAQYGLLILFKAPALMGAMVVYYLTLGLFNVPVSFVEIATFLPLIFLAAALPLPFHAGALLIWSQLFPEFPEVGAFAFVMSLTFVGTNALIGLMFLPHVNKVLLSDTNANGP